MTNAEALALIRRHGVMLISAKGPVPRLTEAIAEEPIVGSWWGHAKSQHIFEVLEGVTDSADVLVCRLLDGKLTLVHRRLWPALVRVARQFPRDRLAWVRQEHTPTGQHKNREVPFPEWVPSDVKRDAESLGAAQAMELLGTWTSSQAQGGGP